MIASLLGSRAPRRRWRFGWILLGSAAVGLCWGGLRAARDPRFLVRNVVIENATAERAGIDPGDFRPHCTEAELRHLAGVRSDRPLWRVDLDDVVEGVLQHPWVASVDATRRWPDTVRIRVVEHRAVMLLKLDGVYYVDAGGEIFKRARGNDLDYPVLTGLYGTLLEQDPDLARRVLRAAVEVLGQVEASAELAAEDVSELHFDALDGFSLVLRGGTELVLGFSGIPARLARLEHLRGQGLDPAVPRKIDLAPSRIALVRPLPEPGVTPSPLPPGLD